MISLVLFMTLILTLEGGKLNYIKLESKLSSTSSKSTSVQDYHVIRLNTITTLVIFIACPSAPTIHFSFFYVPKQNPNRIREKKQSPRTIQIVSEKFWLCPKNFLCFLKTQPNSKTCVFYFIEIFSYLCFLLHKIGQFKVFGFFHGQLKNLTKN